MANEEGGGFVTGFLFGGVVGVLVGVLMAPRAGQDTRAELLERTQHLREQAEVMAEQARHKVEGLASEAITRTQHIREQGKVVASRARGQAHIVGEQAVALADQARHRAEDLAAEARRRAGAGAHGRRGRNRRGQRPRGQRPCGQLAGVHQRRKARVDPGERRWRRSPPRPRPRTPSQSAAGDGLSVAAVAAPDSYSMDRGCPIIACCSSSRLRWAARPPSPCRRQQREQGPTP